MTIKCCNNKTVAHEAITVCVTDVLSTFDVFCDLLLCVTDVLTTFDVFCDLLLNRRTATLNLFVLYNNETNDYT